MLVVITVAMVLMSRDTNEVPQILMLKIITAIKEISIPIQARGEAVIIATIRPVDIMVHLLGLLHGEARTTGQIIIPIISLTKYGWRINSRHDTLPECIMSSSL